VLGVMLHARPATAERVVVPAELQAELFAKVAAYDRNFAKRAGRTAQVVLVVRPNDAKSKLFAATLRAALTKLDQVGGLPHEETIVAYEGAPALAKVCRSQQVAAVYMAPGLDAEVDVIRSALTGMDVLTVGAAPEHVPRGLVLGFDLVSGKPKILVNLEQARKQNVNFRADVLKLMRVYR
jgi:hypothetical protein